MLPSYFALVSAVITVFGGLYYLFDTLTGKAKPNRVTWLLWGLLPTIVFIAQHMQGVGEMSWITLASGLTPYLVFIASFLNRNAYWKTAKTDYILMAVSLIGIGLWVITKQPNIAIVFMIVADLVAGIPTYVKSYRYPESESWIAYALSAFGYLIGVFAIQNVDFQNVAFVVYLLLNEILLTSLVVRSRWHRSQL